MIEQEFYQVLSEATSVTAICSQRIYPLVLPKGADLPAIEYTFVGGSSTGTQDTRGSQRYRVEVNCWGSTYSEAVTLRHAVISELDQYRDDNLYIQWLQNVDLFDHDLEQYRAMAELYLYSNFIPAT